MKDQLILALNKLYGKSVCCKIFGNLNVLKNFNCLCCLIWGNEIILNDFGDEGDEDEVIFNIQNCTIEYDNEDVVIHTPYGINIMLYAY